MNILTEYTLQLYYNSTSPFPLLKIQLYPAQIRYQSTILKNDECERVNTTCFIYVYLYDIYERPIEFDAYSISIKMDVSLDIEGDGNPILHTELFPCIFIKDSYTCEYKLIYSEPEYTNTYISFISESTSLYTDVTMIIKIRDALGNLLDINTSNKTLFAIITLDSSGKQRSLRLTIPFKSQTPYIHSLTILSPLYGYGSIDFYLTDITWDDLTNTEIYTKILLGTQPNLVFLPSLCKQHSSLSPYICYNNMNGNYIKNPIEFFDNGQTIHCVSDWNDCHNSLTCPLGMEACMNRESEDIHIGCQQDIHNCTCHGYICENGACVDNYMKCPSFPIHDTNKVICIDGTIAINKQMCPQQVHCPPSTITCGDLVTCAVSIEECNQYKNSIQCPSYAPILCWDKKSCVIDPIECPSLRFCPKPLILCPDGMCTHNISECIYTTCPLTYPYRCPQGYCVKNATLCPSSITCPKYYHLSPSNQCISDSIFIFGETYNYQYDNKFLYLNLSESAPNTRSKNMNLYSSSSILNNNIQAISSIKTITNNNNNEETTLFPYPLYHKDAYNNIIYEKSLNESTIINIYTNCPKNFYKCNDNTCVVSMLECPTHVSYPLYIYIYYIYLYIYIFSLINLHVLLLLPSILCTFEKPILCDNGTCVENTKDCYSQIHFIERNQQGKTTTNITIPSSSILLTSHCPSAYPYYCSSSKTCVRNSLLCSSPVICPTTSPILCDTGYCVSSYSLCTDESNYHCPLGFYMCDYQKICVEHSYLCPTISVCRDNEMRCEDGGCYMIEDSTYGVTNIFPYIYNSLQEYSEEYLDITEYHDKSDLNIKHTIEQCVSKYLEMYIDVCNVYNNKEDINNCINKIKDRYQHLCSRNYQFYPCRRYNIHYSDDSYYIYSISPYFIPTGDPIASIEGSLTSINKYYWDPLSTDTSFQSNILSNSIPPPLCPKGSKRCIEGSCISQSEQCPSYRICPRNKPILCSDGLCHYHQNQCLNTIHCPINYKLCNDGSCVFITKKCPLLYCPTTNPILCWDQSCHVSEDDCPPIPPYVPSNCLNGKCISTGARQVTKFTSFCSIHGEYVKDRSDCINGYEGYYNKYSMESDHYVTGFCSYDKYLCSDGTCVRDSSLCSEPLCPMFKPYKCISGLCVSSKEECTSNDNCNNDQFSGWCHNTLICYSKDSSKNNIDIYHSSCDWTCNTNGYIRCLDGTCRQSIEDCPLSNGCSSSKPKSCYNGECIKEDEECSPLCVAPYKQCENGLCMISTFYCPYSSYSFIPEDTSPSPSLFVNSLLNKDINNNNSYLNKIMNNIKSIINTLYNTIIDSFMKYMDKSFFTENNLQKSSPLLNEYEHTLINNNTNNKLSLFSSELFESPLVYFVDRQYLYSYFSSLPSLCSEDKPIRCAIGICVKSYTDCPLIMPCNTSNYNTNYIRCSDGSCRASSSLCTDRTICTSPYNYMCKTGLYNGLCVEKEEDCLSDNGCPVSSPYKCPTGRCVKYSYNCTTEYTYHSCPHERPYKCIRGECVRNANECTFINGCSPLHPILCSNGTCVSTRNECSSILNSNTYSCPINQSYICPNGQCVSHPSQCLLLNRCSIYHSQACASGDCIPLHGQRYSPILLSLNIINEDQSDNPYNSIENYTLIQGKETDQEISFIYRSCPKRPICPKDIPFLCDDMSCVAHYHLCKPCINCNQDPEKLPFCPSHLPVECPDGTCVLNEGDCPLLSNCPENLPYHCYNDLCVSSPLYCETLNITLFSSLPSPLSFSSITLCPDGSFRDISLCPPIPPCPTSSPKRCPNGICVDINIDCNSIFISPSGQQVGRSIYSPYHYYDYSIYSKEKSNQINIHYDSTTLSIFIPILYSNNNTYSCFISTYQLCSDGICRLTCPITYGCMKNQLRCPDSTCISFNSNTESTLSCKGLYNCPNNMYRCFDGSCHYSISECLYLNPRDILPYDYRITLLGQESKQIILYTQTNDFYGYIHTPHAQLHSTNLPIFLSITTLSSSQLNQYTYKANNYTRLQELRFISGKPIAIYEPPRYDSSLLSLHLPVIQHGLILNLTFIDIYNKRVESLINAIEIDLMFPRKVWLLPRVLQNNTYYRHPLDITEDEHCIAKLNEKRNEFECLDEIQYRFEKSMILCNIKESGVYGIIIRPKLSKGSYPYIYTNQNFQINTITMIICFVYLPCFIILLYLLFMLLRYKFRWDFMNKTFVKLETTKESDRIEDQWHSETQEWINSGIDLRDRGKYRLTENQYAFETQQKMKQDELWKEKSIIVNKNEQEIKRRIKRIKALQLYYTYLQQLQLQPHSLTRSFSSPGYISLQFPSSDSSSIHNERSSSINSNTDMNIPEGIDINNVDSHSIPSSTIGSTSPILKSTDNNDKERLLPLLQATMNMNLEHSLFSHSIHTISFNEYYNANITRSYSMNNFNRTSSTCSTYDQDSIHRPSLYLSYSQYHHKNSNGFDHKINSRDQDRDRYHLYSNDTEDLSMGLDIDGSGDSSHLYNSRNNSFYSNNNQLKQSNNKKMIITADSVVGNPNFLRGGTLLNMNQRKNNNYNNNDIQENNSKNNFSLNSRREFLSKTIDSSTIRNMRSSMNILSSPKQNHPFRASMSILNISHEPIVDSKHQSMNSSVSISNSKSNSNSNSSSKHSSLYSYKSKRNNIIINNNENNIDIIHKENNENNESNTPIESTEEKPKRKVKKIIKKRIVKKIVKKNSNSPVSETIEDRKDDNNNDLNEDNKNKKKVKKIIIRKVKKGSKSPIEENNDSIDDNNNHSSSKSPHDPVDSSTINKNCEENNELPDTIILDRKSLLTRRSLNIDALNASKMNQMNKNNNNNNNNNNNTNRVKSMVILPQSSINNKSINQENNNNNSSSPHPISISTISPTRSGIHSYTNGHSPILNNSNIPVPIISTIDPSKLLNDSSINISNQIPISSNNTLSHIPIYTNNNYRLDFSQSPLPLWNNNTSNRYNSNGSPSLVSPSHRNSSFGYYSGHRTSSISSSGYSSQNPLSSPNPLIYPISLSHSHTNNENIIENNKSNNENITNNDEKINKKTKKINHKEKQKNKNTLLTSSNRNTSISPINRISRTVIPSDLDIQQELDNKAYSPPLFIPHLQNDIKTYKEGVEKDGSISSISTIDENENKE
ncbi:hypothetical protein WA158_002991 [Blastocystis sp. Blastoise]